MAGQGGIGGPARSERGFTLVELMICIGIIGILAGIWVGNAASASEEARATACEKNRVLYEDAEQLFFHNEKRQSDALQELVDEKYVNKATCPRGGELVWEITDPDLAFAHQSLVCSIHGPKARIRAQKTGSGAAEVDTTIGAGFEDGTFGSWATLGMAAIVGSEFGADLEGDYGAYLDTNKSWSKVESVKKLANFLGVKGKDLQKLDPRKFTGGSAMKITVGNGTLEKLKFNFLTQEATPTYWYNDTAFMSVTNKDTGKKEVYKLSDTFSDFKKSGTKFKEETGWLSLSDLGLDVKVEKGDTLGFGVMNATDKVVSSAILIDEGK